MYLKGSKRSLQVSVSHSASMADKFCLCSYVVITTKSVINLVPMLHLATCFRLMEAPWM